MGSEEVVEEPTPKTPNQTTTPETTSSSSPRKIKTNTPTENGHVSVTPTTLSIVQPHSLLPKPVPPRTTYTQNDVVVSSTTFGKFLRKRSNDLSSAISKGISTLKHSINDQNDNNGVTEFNLSGLKVFVTVKNKNDASSNSLARMKISFFSRSNCRECCAVRRFFRERALRFVEINVDVFAEREKELRERTGSATVPKIFFGERLIGGLVELNALRKDGGEELERRLKEAGGQGPAAPAYGFDEAEEEEMPEEEIGKVVRVLRQRLPIQDRLIKMKIARNCFAGSELVELLVRHHGYSPSNAVEIGKQLCKKHFIHHVFGKNDFEEGNHFYRFLEHEPLISKCFNFRGATNDSEPKAAAAVCDRLTKIMCAILESFASEDRRHVDYVAISKSEELRRYVNMTQDLQRVNLLELSENETLAFFINLYNAMIVHAIIRVGCQEGVINRKSFFDFHYLIGGHPYSLGAIKNGILRSNRRSPYSLIKPFGTGDRRLEHALVKMNPLVHFGLCNGTKSSPKVRFFSPYRVAEELRSAAREFFENDGIEVDLEKRTIHLTPIFKWYSADFGQERNILKWIINFLDANKAGLLTHLLGDGGHVNISYMSYDWSINS
ncbi:hypothetical protein GLYMA_09G280900v4 [Glycine max]|uniref:DEP domain-containing protein n=1 Tax=Glycine soja TaxID=3848 RepID=A0A445J794_GLYSO|nr:uncharacterized protein LOC100784667 [Glycine max]XP_028248704.1 uncharacterized protein LOC114425922 [Glycine soja]KAG5008488.1 hypothetical protein JHK85_027030 [Glycine max]KAG5014280.1 hypothetical protein JHK86_026541 [Glycine max]KAH1235329.1 Glutaredoxin [Glycine max]RCW19266.2 hypothetical protein GLYMA_09G280900v4 [Glycine max]RZB94283.1 hypothetical protein D0Y65_025503 [Glycine soja]